MRKDNTFLQSFVRSLAESVDLLAVVAVVVITDMLVFLSVLDEPLAQTVLGFVFVLFVPGYALVSALFPKAGRSPSGGNTDDPRGTADRFIAVVWSKEANGITGAERLALAFALSLSLVPLLMLLVTFTTLEFAWDPIFATISSVTVSCAAIAAARRRALPEHERFSVPYREWIATGLKSTTDADSRFDAILNVALVLAIALAVGTLTFAIVSPPDGERFTEFYVLNESDNGELFAANYPESLSPAEPETFHIGIENYEQKSVEYSVVVQLQRVNGEAIDQSITDRVEVDRFSMTLAHNERAIREQELTISDELTGDGLRLTFLLYVGPVPETPTRDNAYRSLHLWVDVETAA